jgi:toxin ParE1/3/4
MELIVSRRALRDMTAIGRYIALDNPSRAETFVSELQLCCQQLTLIPRAFALLPNHKEMGIRRRPFGAYLIFYRVSAEAVEILHVLHAARDYRRILFGKD